MALYEFEGKQPSIGAGSFVPETADVVGDVTIGEKCFIGVGARIRGDYGSIVIGNRPEPCRPRSGTLSTRCA